MTNLVHDELARLRERPGIKWRSADPAVIPAWVAEMDFPPPPTVLDALRTLADAADLGYPAWVDDTSVALGQIFARRMSDRHGWFASPRQSRLFTDVKQAIAAILYSATAPGDLIALHVPAYAPLLRLPEALRRRVVPMPLHPHAAWDLDALAGVAARREIRAFVLVNPHNPTGRVFPVDELTELARIADRYGLLVIADEVHAEFCYDSHKHVPFGALYPDAVTVTSAGKAFNIAGLRCAIAHVGDASARAALDRIPPHLLGEVGVAGVVATAAAWQHGDKWLAAIRNQLAVHRESLRALADHGVGYRPPDGTYLAWLDLRVLGVDDPAALLRRTARVDLTPGHSFGSGGTGFARLTFATSATVLAEIIRRIGAAVEECRG